MPSTRVVLPWSTWAMMAMFLKSSRRIVVASKVLDQGAKSFPPLFEIPEHIVAGRSRAQEDGVTGPGVAPGQLDGLFETLRLQHQRPRADGARDLGSGLAQDDDGPRPFRHGLAQLPIVQLFI